jgi:hypothetical protein
LELFPSIVVDGILAAGNLEVDEYRFIVVSANLKWDSIDEAVDVLSLVLLLDNFDIFGHDDVGIEVPYSQDEILGELVADDIVG